MTQSVRLSVVVGQSCGRLVGLSVCLSVIKKAMQPLQVTLCVFLFNSLMVYYSFGTFVTLLTHKILLWLKKCIELQMRRRQNNHETFRTANSTKNLYYKIYASNDVWCYVGVIRSINHIILCPATCIKSLGGCLAMAISYATGCSGKIVFFSQFTATHPSPTAL